MARPATRSGSRGCALALVVALALGGGLTIAVAVVVTNVVRALMRSAEPPRPEPDLPPDVVQALPCRSTVRPTVPVFPTHSNTPVHGPRRIHNAAPVYPATAQAARIQGVVILEITIDCNGVVTESRVLRSIPGLDEAALDTVRQWRYAPTVEKGERVPVIMTVTVNFTLQS